MEDQIPFVINIHVCKTGNAYKILVKFGKLGTLLETNFNLQILSITQSIATMKLVKVN